MNYKIKELCSYRSGFPSQLDCCYKALVHASLCQKKIVQCNYVYAYDELPQHVTTLLACELYRNLFFMSAIIVI